MAFQATGEWLAREISLSGDITYDEALDALHGVSDGMLALLASPSGWYALAAFIEMNLGRPLSGYAPTVH
jgi:hypothetical protein